MKKIKFFACALSLVLLFGLLSLSTAAEEETPAGAVFSGTGMAFAPADSATLAFELLTPGTTQTKAQRENKKTLDSLRAALQAECGEAPDLCEIGYHTEEGFSGTRFLVRRTLTLSTAHPERAEALRDCLIAHGVSSVLGITYTCADTAPYREEALRLAVADAKSKAAALGLALPLLEIRDFGCYDCGLDCGFGCPAMPAPHATAICVVCNVELRFGSSD